MNNNNSEKNLNMLAVLDHLREYVKEKGWEEKYRNTMEYLVLDHVLITSINRVARQKNSKRKEIIKQMREYVLRLYPHFSRDPVYLNMKRNRRIIAYLNSRGLHQLSRLILDTKEKMRRAS